jgi:hypothetical protein
MVTLCLTDYFAPHAEVTIQVRAMCVCRDAGVDSYSSHFNQPTAHVPPARDMSGPSHVCCTTTVRGWFLPITSTQIVPIVATTAIGISAIA